MLAKVKKKNRDIAKRNKLDDTEFFMKWALGQIGTVNEDLDEVTLNYGTVIEFIVNNLKNPSSKESKDVINYLGKNLK